ncbi:hypothetical protein GXP70_15470 [Paenibacillus lycopersici]|uniref:MmcQ/YjbR family DNA-binding protein n=1 Tax=Paenibacillus lycopersici TaxID=2704462 RepID=A0A6C0G846_9BACL|nr:hypothetical protein GXP70_15470 [Paenibacillus lycopersici]
MHQDGQSLVLKVAFEDREFLLELHPAIFYLTDHYRNHPSVLVRLAAVDRHVLQEYIELAWLRCAPKRLAAAYTRNAAD